jgi:hypothetical protein
VAQVEQIPDVPDPESRRHRAEKTSKAWATLTWPIPKYILKDGHQSIHRDLYNHWKDSYYGMDNQQNKN